MRGFPSKRLSLMAAVLCAAAPARAEDLAETQALEGLTVVGDWLGEASEDAVRVHPGARTALRDEQWKAAGATTLREALRRAPGVVVPENNGTGSADSSLNIGVRGLPSRLTPRSTVLLDGVPLSVAPYGQPQLSLAPVALGNLQAIDIVRGGGAVRYGPQNVGGIINFVTKPIPLDPSASLSVQTEAYGRGSNDGLGRTHTDALVGGTTDIGLGLALLYSGNHGANYRANSDQDIDDLMLKYGFALGDRTTVEGKLHYYTVDAELPGGLSQAQYDADRFQSLRPFDATQGNRREAVLKLQHEFANATKVETMLFANESFREFTLANAGGAAITRVDRFPREYQVLGIEPRLSHGFATGPLTHEASVGYRYIEEQANEKQMRRSGFGAGGNPFSVAERPNRDSDNETNAHAFYVDDTLRYGRLAVTPGVRLEKVEVSRHDNLTGFDNGEKFFEVLPSLNVIYELTPALRAFANYNTSFGSIEHLQLNLRSDNVLEPERARTYELGSRYDGAGWRAEATLFRTEFDNQIVYDAGLQYHINAGATLHHGLELAVAYDFDSWTGWLSGLSLYGTYTYVRAERREGPFKGNDLPFVSAHVGSLGAAYGVDRWTLNVDGYAQSSQFSDEANTVAGSADGSTGRIPGFAYWNVRAAYDLGFEAVPAQVAVGIKNLFDQDYFTRSDDTNGGLFAGAPRTIYVQGSLRF